MPTLNRFPLLGLWAREAARRIGYPTPDAEALGHAYAVLFAIRANMRPQPSEGESSGGRTQSKQGVDELRFAGETLDVVYDDAGHVLVRVGGDRPQTSRTYRTSVASKFPPGYLSDLAAAFRKVLRAYPPKTLDGKLVYDLYDEWKKACAVGRRVDLDCLIDWCERRAKGRTGKKAQAVRGSTPSRSRKSRASSRAAPPTSLLK